MGASAEHYLSGMFGLKDKTAIITGGAGVLGGAIANGLAQAGAKVAILSRRVDRVETMVQQIRDAGGEAIAVPGDVMSRDSLDIARDKLMSEWGRIDILVNAAGGTTPQATVAPDKTIFDMPFEPMHEVLNLNVFGTILPSQAFGQVMAAQREGCILNISSMNAQNRALTRGIAYGAGKAAAENFTRWLAVELALKFGPGMRVNAIAPGFFLGEQNRALLVNDDGLPTVRGQTIINHTPAGRFGEPDDLVGAALWLCSPAARFVNGAVVMVDGGAAAFSGI